MKWNDAQTESMKMQWNFYERTINNYSIIMRIMKAAENDSLIDEISRIFVEESFFDMCAIVFEDNGMIRDSFYSIDSMLHRPDNAQIESVCTGINRATITRDVLGYGLLYLYPLRDDTKTTGYLVLGKRYNIMVKPGFLRELEMIAEICNMSLMQGRGMSYRRKFYTPSFFEAVLESFPDPLILVDSQGFIGYANKGAIENFETPKGFLLGEMATEAITGLPEEFVKNRQPFQGEINYRSQNEYRVFRVEGFIVPEVGENREWLAILFKDVVASKADEEEQFLKKRNESIGMLAGGIAHDFNNMLTGILGYATLMKRMIPDEKLSRYAEAIENSAQRASGLTRHLLNFSRRQKASTGIVELNSLLDDVFFLLKESFHDISIEKDFEDHLPNIRGDEAQLQNVFLNLFINAKDAMDGTGLLRVRTSSQTEGYICIDIEDTGKGIDGTLRHKIFEPYFSTKDNVMNLGMGLYLVDKVIREHGGFIKIESESDKGTCFSVYLPVSAEHQTVNTMHSGHDDMNSLMKGKTILIIDDEPLIRNLLTTFLYDYGSIILEAQDGMTGLEQFRNHGKNIDLIILDMIMPGMKGDEVLRRIREDNRHMKVIISSGFMSEEQRAKLNEYHVNGFLDKPFKDNDALAIIRQVIELPSDNSNET